MKLLNADLDKYKIKATNLKEIRPHSKIDIGNFSIFPNALDPIDFTVDGIVILVTSSQLLNTFSPIVVTLLNVIVSTFIHPLNAFELIVNNVSGSVNVVRDLHPLNE